MKLEIDHRIPRPERYPSESALQIAVVAGAMRMVGEHPEVALLHAIPNGDWRGPRVAQRLKAEGVKPGIPDLFLPVPRGGYHGLYIELKNGRGTVSREQWVVMGVLQAHGYLVRILNDLPMALILIRSYLEYQVLRHHEEN